GVIPARSTRSGVAPTPTGAGTAPPSAGQDAAEGSGKRCRGGREENNNNFNPERAKTTPREVVAAAPVRIDCSVANSPVTRPVWPFHAWRCLRVFSWGRFKYFALGVHRGLGGKAFLFLRGHGDLGGEASKEVHNSLYLLHTDPTYSIEKAR